MARTRRGRETLDKKRSPIVVALIAAAVVGVGAIGYAVSTGVGNSQMATEPIEVEGLDDSQRLLELAQSVTLGDEGAPITIMEFADYSCPHCRVFREQIKPRIELMYIQEGKAKFVVHDYVLGGFPHSFVAARAARCAGDQQRYWEYHDALFTNQPVWSTSASPPVRHLLSYAEDIGLDREEFESCLRSDKYADVVTANRHLAQQLNLGGTPAVLIHVAGSPLPMRVDDPDIWIGITQRVDSILAASQVPAGQD